MQMRKTNREKGHCSSKVKVNDLKELLENNNIANERFKIQMARSRAIAHEKGNDQQQHASSLL